MTTDSWIALGGLLVVMVSAIVTFAMKVAALQEAAKNRDRRIDEEQKSRAESDVVLHKRIDNEEAERKKRDSDLFRDVKELDERCVRRYEKRVADMQALKQKPKEAHDSDG